MFTVKNAAIIVDNGVKTLDDLRMYRNINKVFRNAVDNHSTYVWKRLLTQQNFDEAASKNYLPFLRMVITSKKNLSYLRAFQAACAKKRYEFCGQLVGKMSDIEVQIALFVALRYGFAPVVENLLRMGVDKETVYFTHEKEQKSQITFYQLLVNWFPNQQFEPDEDEGFNENGGIISVDDAIMEKHDQQLLSTIFHTINMRPIDAAARSGDLETVKTVMSYQPCLQPRAIISTTELAARSGNKKVLRYLLLNGFKIEYVSDRNFEDKQMEEYYLRFLIPGWPYMNLKDEFTADDEEDHEMFSELCKGANQIELIACFGNARFYPLLGKTFAEDDRLLFKTMRLYSRRFNYCQKRPLFMRYLVGLVFEKLDNFKDFIIAEDYAWMYSFRG